MNNLAILMSTIIDQPTETREKISVHLEKLLADTYTLYLMSHNFHWNVKGTDFYSYHKMFEEHYLALADAVDEIAERIRAIGFTAPATFRQFSELTTIDEPEGIPQPMEMVKIAASAHKEVIKQALKVLEVADDHHDVVTVDLVTQRLTYHEKVLWMLNTILA